MSTVEPSSYRQHPDTELLQGGYRYAVYYAAYDEVDCRGAIFVIRNRPFITFPYRISQKFGGKSDYLYFCSAKRSIKDDTQTYLDTPMFPAEVFVKTLNGIFEGMLKK
jgi:hypothetical protein